MSIPKIIHYCWFGGKPLPKMAKKCIESWKKHCPDYEIMRWDESNFDIKCSQYCFDAYKAKKYAFVSDCARLYALVTHGGIYMDTDVEVVKPLSDEFLLCDAFSGFETDKTILTGIMACEKGNELFKKLLSYYDNVDFILQDGTYNMTTNVKIITDICLENGFVPNNQKQTVCGFTLYPKDYFCPLSHDDVMCFSENTYTIHHFNGSWCDYKTKFVGVWNRKYKILFNKFFGHKLSDILYRIIYNFCRFSDFVLKK